ncbi:MAG: DUF1700 domain-containing protein [Blautia sp.]|nr:DUF1700 domain-containing protein [Blautia sp.]
MDKILEDYLEKIDKYLKPMPVTSRLDIVQEIRSEMHELEAQEHLRAKDIIQKLGNPKDLATAYLSESIVQRPAFNLKNLCQIAAFYGLAGFGSLFVLPFCGILSIALMLCSIIAPLAGIVKAAGFLIGVDVPVIMFQFGAYTAHPLLAFPLSVILGLLFFLAGKGLWKLMIRYINAIGRQKRNLIQGRLPHTT